ncbi:transglutaminase-like cysteine peptidase [Roseobacter sp.]|uniref:transglutaminase-like cysteine peptidase n=1 Tax=Roseobacter sp. TaxID=1907202 RepID=UPI00385A4AFC
MHRNKIGTQSLLKMKSKTDRPIGQWHRSLVGMPSVFPVIFAALVSFGLVLTEAKAGQTGDSFLISQQPTRAPAGFQGLCARYNWVCASSSNSGLSDATTMTKAKQVNLTVNRRVREIGDQAQYGKVEHWALPTKRGGDCEDLVLLKKKMLLAQGIPSQSLLIATVLDRELNSHAVLIVRTQSGDQVLDNLTDRIVGWKKTGYTFLKMQNPSSLRNWDAVIAGGVISDRPTASQ